MITVPRYDRNNGVLVLYPKTEILEANVTADIRERWLGLCAQTGLGSSEYVRLLIDLEIDGMLFSVEREK